MALNLGVRALVAAMVGGNIEWLHGRIIGVDDDVHGRPRVVGVRLVGGGVVWSLRQDVRIVCGRCGGCLALNNGTDCMRQMTAADVDDLLMG